MKFQTLIFSTILFSFGWFWISFTFPLKLEAFGLNFIQISFLSLFTSLPFVFISLLIYIRNVKLRSLFFKIPFFFLSISCLLLILFPESLPILILSLILSGTFQSLFWISSEIVTYSFERDLAAEKYSNAWSIPSGFFTLASGFFLQDFSYLLAYTIILLISIVGSIIPIDFIDQNEIHKKGKNLEFSRVLPMFLAGIAIGFFSFTLPSKLFSIHYSYVDIGIITGSLGGSFAIGSALSNIKFKGNGNLFQVISGFSLSLPSLFIIFKPDLIFLSIAAILLGVFSGYSFSYILSYINLTENPRRGVMYYESLFSAGYISSNIIGGFLLENYGLNAGFCIFLFSIPFTLFYFNKYYSFLTRIKNSL